MQLSRKIIFGLIFIVSQTLVYGQQDCFDAIYLCTTTYTQNNSFAGVGTVQEVTQGATCLGNGEANSVWYRFTVNTSGTLTFQLAPFNANDDYDFALFDLTNDSCSGIANGTNTPISCNYSSTTGATGLSNGGSGNQNSSSGPNQNAQINVQQGNTYALMISNFTASQSGYSLSFGGSASMSDNQAALPDSISLNGICNPNQVFLFFDDEFDCSSVAGLSEISVTGPSALTVTQVSGIGCANGTSDQLRIRFANKIQVVGTYTITINSGADGNTLSDGCGNQTPPGTTFSFTVDYIGPDANITNIVNTSCGSNDGSAEAVVTSGTAPFTYNWNSSPSQNTPVATQLSAGTYRVRVTDANGCQDRATVTIQNDSPLNQTTSSITGASCFGANDGSVQLTPLGGLAPYTVSWSSNPPQIGNLATGLPAGPITAELIDFSGCLQEFNFVVPQPPAILIDIAPVLPDCGFNNGTLSANVTGGNGVFSYEWNLSPIQTTSQIMDVGAGIYELTVTDDIGCSNSMNYILVNANAPDVDVVNRIPDCGQNSGQATVVPSVTTQNYTFEWNTSPPQNTATATGLALGEYLVTITDENGCTQIRNVKIDGINPPQISLTLQEASCGASDGEASATVVDGIPPYLYNWSSSANTTDTEIGLTAGSYTVTVIDSIGCTDTELFNLNQLPPTSNFTWNDVCVGYEMSFDVETNSGATTYEWSFGDGDVSSLEDPNHLYSTSGTFEASVILQGGCMNDTVTYSVNVFSPPSVSFVTQPDILTTQTNAQFTYTGNAATAFYWDFGDGSSVTEQNPIHRFGEEGFYTVDLIATDSNGCIDSTSQTVEVLLQPVIYFPNAFVPSGTEENSRFKGYGLGVVSAELSIYDRWGTLLFFSNNARDILINGWDGIYKGREVQQGAYPYKVKAVFYTGSTFEKLGTVTLIR